MSAHLNSAAAVEGACEAVRASLQLGLCNITSAIAAINPAFDLDGAVRSLQAGIFLNVSIASAAIEQLVAMSGYTEAEKADLRKALAVLQRMPNAADEFRGAVQ